MSHFNPYPSDSSRPKDAFGELTGEKAENKRGIHIAELGLIIKYLILLSLVGCASSKKDIYCEVKGMFNGDSYPIYICYDEDGNKVDPDTLQEIQ